MPFRSQSDIEVMATLRGVAIKQSAISGVVHKIVCVLPVIVNKKLQGGRIRNRFMSSTALPDGHEWRI